MKNLPIYLSLLLLLTCAKEDSQDPGTTPSNITPKYTLTASAGEGGSVAPSSGSFNSGTQVSITATPNSGYTFSGWSNGSSDNPVTVTLSSNTSITANFALIPVYTLSVSAEEGGSVSSEGGDYQQGTEVTITATPDEGYEFSGWSDGSTETTRVITSSEDLTLTASFTELIISYTLTVTSTEGGSISSEGGEYNEGTEVTLTATPGEGYRFTGWSDDSTEESITITITEDTSIEAIFEKLIVHPFIIHIGNSDLGTYNVEIISGGQDPLTGGYYDNTELRLVAQPNQNANFCGWGADISSIEDEITITIIQNTTINLCLIEKSQYKLTINIYGIGSVSDGEWEISNSDNENPLVKTENYYYDGDEVTLSTLGGIDTKFIYYKTDYYKYSDGGPNDEGPNNKVHNYDSEINYIINKSFYISIYFAPKYYSESYYRFDETNYTNSHDIDNLGPTLTGATVKFYIKSNGIEYFVAAGTNPFYDEQRAPTITFRKQDDIWVIDKVHEEAPSMQSRNMKIISDSEFMFSDSGEHANPPWLGNIWYGKIDSNGFEWTKVNADNEMGFFHGVSAGDLNGDGLIDFGGVPNTSGYTYGIFIQNNDGSFTKKNELLDFSDSNNGIPFTLDFSDLDGDGIDEIITADYGEGWYDPISNNKINNIQVYKFNSESGVFEVVFDSDEPTVLANHGMGGSSIIVSDFNNDGIKDISVAREGGGEPGIGEPGSSIEVWLGKEDLDYQLSFTKVWDAEEIKFREFVVLDADNDGFNDIVLRTNGGFPLYITDSSWSGVSFNESILINDGTGKFEPYSKKELKYYHLPQPSNINPYVKDGKLGIIASGGANHWLGDGYFESYILDFLIDLNDY